MKKSPWHTFTIPKQVDKSVKDFEAVRALPKIKLRERHYEKINERQNCRKI